MTSRLSCPFPIGRSEGTGLTSFDSLFVFFFFPLFFSICFQTLLYIYRDSLTCNHLDIFCSMRLFFRSNAGYQCFSFLQTRILIRLLLYLLSTTCFNMSALSRWMTFYGAKSLIKNHDSVSAPAFIEFVILKNRRWTCTSSAVHISCATSGNRDDHQCRHSAASDMHRLWPLVQIAQGKGPFL